MENSNEQLVSSLQVAFSDIRKHEDQIKLLDQEIDRLNEKNLQIENKYAGILTKN